MKYTLLGCTGLTVSKACLGTMTFGAKAWGCDATESKRILDTFIGAGGNFIDTADVYAAGTSEEILGHALRDHSRDDLVVATKCFFRTGPGANSRGLSRKHIEAACAASLRRMSMDYIDLYYVHGPDPFTPIEETMSALESLVRAGKVRYIGCSNWAAWQFARANGIARTAGIQPFVAGQYLYNLVQREPEQDLLPACEAEGMGFVVWSPLAGGLLSGKYQAAPQPPAGSRIAHRPAQDIPRFWHQHGFEVARQVVDAAAMLKVPPAQVALAWLRTRRGVCSVILGARTVEQLCANLRAGDLDLPAEVISALNRATTPKEDHLGHFARQSAAIFTELDHSEPTEDL